jgi:hypothetical protein
MSIRRCCLALLIAAGCEPSSPIYNASAPDAAVASDTGVDVTTAMDQSEDRPPPGPRVHGFILTATLPSDSANPDAGTGSSRYSLTGPSEDHFTIYVDEQAKYLIASRPGTAAKVAIVATPTGWRAAKTFELSMPSTAWRCDGLMSMSYDRLEFAIDGDRISGTIEGVAYLSGDTTSALPFRGTFTGTPDREPPVLSVESTPPHPADVMVITASEALPPGTVADLVRGDGTRVRLESLESGESVVAFASDRLGARAGYHLELTPALVDYVGNRGDLANLPPVDTRPVPLVAGDFEGDPLPLLEAPAEIVGGERFPPIAGQRSLLVPSNYPGGPARASMRVKVTPGQTVIHVTVRTLSMTPSGYGPDMSAIAPDGSSTRAKVAEPTPPFTAVEGGFMLGSPQTLEFDLPSGAKDEVMIDIRSQLICDPFFGSSLGLLIDEIGTAP